MKWTTNQWIKHKCTIIKRMAFETLSQLIDFQQKHYFPNRAFKVFRMEEGST